MKSLSFFAALLIVSSVVFASGGNGDPVGRIQINSGKVVMSGGIGKTAVGGPALGGNETT